MHREKRFADFIIKFPVVARGVRQIENILHDSFIEALKAGNHALDVVANPAVIGNQSPPIDRAAIS